MSVVPRTFSTHTLIYRDNRGDDNDFVLEHHQYDFPTHADAEADAHTRPLRPALQPTRGTDALRPNTGVFTDSGCLSAQHYSREEAEAAMTESIAAGEPAEWPAVQPICEKHEDQPARTKAASASSPRVTGARSTGSPHAVADPRL